MKAKIVSYRKGIHTQNPKQMIIQAVGVESKEAAEKLVGKSVTWKSPAGKEIKGEVSAAHGNKGAVRAIFEKGLPGQAVTNEVSLN